MEIIKLADIEKNYLNYTEKGFDLVSNMMRDDNSAGMWDAEIKAFMDAITLKSLFFGEDWVYIVVDIVATKIANQIMKVYEKKIVNGKTISEPADDHPLNNLLEQPNEYQDYFSYMYCHGVELCLMGNLVIWNMKSNGQMLILPSETVALKFDEKSKLQAYQITSTTNLMNRENVPLMEFSPKDIIHAKRPNPSSLYWGLSPFVPGRKSVLFSRYSQDFLNSFYLRNALPGLALQMEKHVNEDVALKLLRSFEQTYTGRKSQRRTILIPKGIKAEQINQTIADQNLIDLIDKNRETIINILKVPKHELSIAQTGSLGSEEYKQALKNFWASTLKPMMKLIAGSYNKYFAKQLGENFYFKFDLSDVEILKDDEIAKADLAEKMLKTHTLNEVRAKIYDEGPLDGGDNTPGKQEQTFTAQPQQQEEEQPEQQEEEPEENKTVEIYDMSVPEYAKEFIDMSFKVMNDEAEKKEKRLTENSLELIAKLAESSIAAIKKHVVEKAQEIDSKRRLRQDILGAMSQNESAWLEVQVEELQSVVDEAYNVALAPIFKYADKPALEAIKIRDKNKRRLSLRSRGLESFVNITESETEKIMQIVEDGLAKGRTIDKITPEISQYFKEPENVLFRARRIARTETLTAFSIGKIAAENNFFEVVGEDERKNYKKTWITSEDERVRGTKKTDKANHVKLNNKSVDMGEKFENGLKWPRDPSVTSKPEEVINCRCDYLIEKK